MINRIRQKAAYLLGKHMFLRKIKRRLDPLSNRKLLKQQAAELANLKAEYAWFKWFYSEYAATLRMLQYQKATLEINQKYIEHREEFIEIDSVIRTIIAPPPTNGPFTKEYIYFAARMAFLPNESRDEVSLYAMSYLGNADFAHSKQSYDAFIDNATLRSSNGLIQLTKKANWVSEFMQNDKIVNMEYAYEGQYKHFRPFSYNTGDFDQDGKHDLMLGGKLLLSSTGYDPKQGFNLPMESIFLKTKTQTLLLSLDNNELIVSQYDGSKPIELCRTPIQSAVYSDIPYVLFPLPFNNHSEGLFAIRTKRGLDIYALSDKNIPELRWWLTGLAEKEVLIGAFGAFISKEYTDFWISQVATGTERLACADQLLLISMSKLLHCPAGEVALQDVLYFTVKGSEKYSDYDGISSSLSPIAGDLDGDGKPDLSFVGHRHMNEAGALYILLNQSIEEGAVIDIRDKHIIKILGKPMSQLAPPYVHWDATDLTGNGHCDIILSADNDLYSGLHAGAIYVLDSKKILELWADKFKVSDFLNQ